MITLKGYAILKNGTSDLLYANTQWKVKGPTFTSNLGHAYIATTKKAATLIAKDIKPGGLKTHRVVRLYFLYTVDEGGNYVVNAEA